MGCRPGGCGSERGEGALEGDFASVLEGLAASGVEEPGEITGHGDDGGDDVDGGEESFIEKLEVAHDLISGEDGIAESVLLLAEAVPWGLLGGREDGGGETGEVDILRGRMGLGGEHALALGQDSPARLQGMWLEVPGIEGGNGDAFLGGGDRLVFVQEGQVLGGEDVAGGRGGGGVTIELGVHRTSIPLHAWGPAELATQLGPFCLGRGGYAPRDPGGAWRMTTVEV